MKVFYKYPVKFMFTYKGVKILSMFSLSPLENK